jgi:hypothetical protein
VVGEGAPGAVALSKPLTKYLSNGATNPIHARYYCGGNNLPKVRIRAHPPAAPPFAASKPGSFGAGSTLQTHNAAQAEYDRLAAPNIVFG